jgi:hypothetical protein
MLSKNNKLLSKESVVWKINKANSEKKLTRKEEKVSEK